MNRRRQTGAALLVTTWTVLLIASLVSMAVLSARAELRRAQGFVERMQQRHAADSALTLAMLRILAAPSAAQVPVSTTETIEGTAVTVAIADEAGKVDVNRANPALLEAIFAEGGVPQAAMLASAVVTERIRLEATPGRSLPFESVDQLMQVPGFDHAAVGCLAPYLTVLTGSTTPDARHAAPAVRAAMGRATGAPPVVTESVLDAGATAAGRIYALTASIERDGVTTQIRRALVRLTGNPRQPFLTYVWGPASATDLVGCAGNGAAADLLIGSEPPMREVR